MAYKKLIKVSNVCQLLDKRKFPASTTINGVTFTNNGDGSITLNGTATGLCQYRITNSYKKLIGENTNKCLLVGSISADSGTPYYLQLDFIEGNSWSRAALDFGKGTIFTNSDSSLQLLSIIVKSGVTVNNLNFKPQLFDLTEMYGAGNEPTTAEQFRQDFPEEMYDYSPYCWLTSYKRVILTGGGYYLTSYQRNLTCKTKNLFPYPYFETTRTKNGITFTDNGDGSITANGTATGNAPFYLFESSTSLMGLKAGSTYTISMEGSTASCYLVVNYYSDGSWHSGRFDSFHPEWRTKTIPSTWEGFQCYILVVPGATINNVVFKPMIELGSTATDYVPYGHL